MSAPWSKHCGGACGDVSTGTRPAAGSMSRWLSSPVSWSLQEHLRAVKRDIGPQYVRFHGLLNDDMSVVLDKNSYFNVFSVYDFLLSIGMRPIVELRCGAGVSSVDSASQANACMHLCATKSTRTGRGGRLPLWWGVAIGVTAPSLAALTPWLFFVF